MSRGGGIFILLEKGVGVFFILYEEWDWGSFFFILHEEGVGGRGIFILLEEGVGGVFSFSAMRGLGEGGIFILYEERDWERGISFSMKRWLGRGYIHSL